MCRTSLSFFLIIYLHLSFISMRSMQEPDESHLPIQQASNGLIKRLLRVLIDQEVVISELLRDKSDVDRLRDFENEYFVSSLEL